MNRASAIWLVASREILERGRSKGFAIGLALGPIVIVASMLLQSTLLDGVRQIQIGYVGAPSAEMERVIRLTAESQGGSAELVRYHDLAAAEAALADDIVDGVIVPGVGDTPARLLFQREPDGRVVGTVGEAFRFLDLQDAGVSPRPVIVSSVEPVDPDRGTSVAIANIGVIVLFVTIFSFGYWVLSGVVEEKQSRVVEVVISTIRPRDLLMGKVVGIGLLGLVQVLLIVVTVVIGARLTGGLTLPVGALPTLVGLVTWFVVGYLLYSTLLGALGALASRMEEASTATTPVSFLAMGSYFVSLLVVANDPGGQVARISTFIPPVAPMVVPMRIALGAIEPWEIIGSVAAAVAFIAVLFVVGGRVYSGAVLRTGGLTRLRDAWAGER